MHVRVRHHIQHMLDTIYGVLCMQYQRRTALIVATIVKKLDIVELLLKHKPDCYKQDEVKASFGELLKREVVKEGICIFRTISWSICGSVSLPAWV